MKRLFFALVCLGLMAGCAPIHHYAPQNLVKYEYSGVEQRNLSGKAQNLDTLIGVSVASEQNVLYGHLSLIIINRKNVPIRANAFADRLTFVTRDNKQLDVKLQRELYDVTGYESELINPGGQLISRINLRDPLIMQQIHSRNIKFVVLTLGLEQFMVFASPKEEIKS